MCAVKLASVTLFEANLESVYVSLGIEVGTKYNINTKLKLEDMKPKVPPQIVVGT